MKEKKDIEIAYSEPENYFPKEVREIFFNEREPNVKGFRAVFCDNCEYDDYVLVNKVGENLECIEMIEEELYSPDGIFGYRYFLLVHTGFINFYQVRINKDEYNKLFKLNDNAFLSLASKIINQDKRGKNPSHIKVFHRKKLKPYNK